MSAELVDPLRLSLSERLKLLLPGGLHLANIVRRELRKGEPELHLIPFLSDPARLALDIGANKGVYSHVLRRHARAVHAFEPHPKMLRFLRRNIGRSAKIHAVALSEQDSSAELRIPRWKRGYSNQGASLSTAKIEHDYFSLSVETRRLDGMQLDPVGFMKIDVEGFELAVLEGARETIERDRPVLLIEIEEKHSKIPLVESIGTITARGYSCLALIENRLTMLSDSASQQQAASAGVFNFIFLPEPMHRSA